MSDHKVEIFKNEYPVMDRWSIRIDWPYGLSEFAWSRWGAYRKARRMLKRMDQPHETYYVPRGEA